MVSAKLPDDINQIIEHLAEWAKGVQQRIEMERRSEAQARHDASARALGLTPCAG
jgi:stage III sporulation protein SpoIIIAA